MNLVLLAVFLKAALQTADSPDAAAPPVATNSIEALFEMVRHIGPVALVVLVLLGLASIYSWSIILSKWGLFRRARVQSGRFVRAFRKAERLQDIAAVAEQFKPSPLVPIFDDVYAEYRRQTNGFGAPRSLVALERTAQTAASETLTRMESRMMWLATIGAITPFLGLFGTIMGIIDAFHGLGTAGAATLRAVAPGVSEALITTAAGIAVAVPSVIGYNQLTAGLREFGARMDDFARELMNAFEEAGAGDVEHSRQAAHAAAPAGRGAAPFGSAVTTTREL